jgi:hypothetical protein
MIFSTARTHFSSSLRAPVARRSFATTILRQHPLLEKKSAAYARTAEVSAALPPDRQEGPRAAPVMYIVFALHHRN